MSWKALDPVAAPLRLAIQIEGGQQGGHRLFRQ
jgi:hypothetical protein